MAADVLISKSNGLSFSGLYVWQRLSLLNLMLLLFYSKSLWRAEEEQTFSQAISRKYGEFNSSKRFHATNQFIHIHTCSKYWKFVLVGDGECVLSPAFFASYHRFLLCLLDSYDAWFNAWVNSLIRLFKEIRRSSFVKFTQHHKIRVNGFQHL